MNAIFKKPLLVPLSIFVIVIVILMVRMFYGEAGQREGFVGQRLPRKSVPVIPNEGIIKGKVLGCCVISSLILDIQPEQTIYSLELLIDSSEDVKGRRNFTKDKVGKLLSVYSKEKILSKLFNKVIKAHVTYRGNERSGRFWIWDIEVLDQGKYTEIKQKLFDRFYNHCVDYP